MPDEHAAEVGGSTHTHAELDHNNNNKSSI